MESSATPTVQYEKRHDLITPQSRHWYVLTGTLSGPPTAARLEPSPTSQNYQLWIGQQPKPQICCQVVSIAYFFSGHSDMSRVQVDAQAGFRALKIREWVGCEAPPRRLLDFSEATRRSMRPSPFHFDATNSIQRDGFKLDVGAVFVGVRQCAADAKPDLSSLAFHGGSCRRLRDRGNPRRSGLASWNWRFWIGTRI